MASIIEGYTYDIFISYRQKDNKGDRWVSEFVDALKDELESTFKEEISVYFDINPHDGLLETHDVDASLKEKLKCLVFIPIISRTYCDPKSFAWEHEFKPFVEQASQDQFGLKVKLPNGNVANRVLPVRIHDLDLTDIKLCESLLGGVLRGVEFIYQEPGVNRSLSPKDHEEKNLNNTNYRNQINKVALAMKEIILGMTTGPVKMVKEKTLHIEPLEEVKKEVRIGTQEKPAKLNKRKLFSAVAILVVLIITAIIAYPKIFKRNTLEKLRSSGEKISVAVMPFQNMTNDTLWNVWQDGIQNLLITSLSNLKELQVKQTESINGLIQSKNLTNNASITPSVASNISKRLDANIFISGSINQAGTRIRVIAQLFDSKTEEFFKSFQIEGPSKEEMIFDIIDSLSAMVKNYLIISNLNKETTSGFQNYTSTNSPEAYRYFIYGMNAFMKNDFPAAINMLTPAIAIDSNFAMAALALSINYKNNKDSTQAKKWCLKAYEKRDQVSMWQRTFINWNHALFFETPSEEIKYLTQLLEFDDQVYSPHYLLGLAYNKLPEPQYDKAMPELERAIEICNERDSKPVDYNYIALGTAYNKTGQYEKEIKLYEKLIKDYPIRERPYIRKQAILSLIIGKSVTANRYIKKYISNFKSEAIRKSYTALIYSDAGILDKAEKYYRQANSLEPDSASRMNALAYFLIDKERNITEGLELVEKALKIDPDNSAYLDCKGWGFYKQRKYKEALDLLERGKTLSPSNNRLNLHIQEVKKAIASRK